MAILGHSGGGVYALACAYALPTRVVAVGIVSGGAPLLGAGAMPDPPSPWRALAHWSQVTPWVFRLWLWLGVRRLRANPTVFWERTAAGWSAADARAVREPALQ
jgi:pimeloyl-ACP methyl ester carboxylesterase